MLHIAPARPTRVLTKRAIFLSFKKVVRLHIPLPVYPFMQTDYILKLKKIARLVKTRVGRAGAMRSIENPWETRCV